MGDIVGWFISQLVDHCGADRNISTAIRCIVMKLDIRGARRMNPNDFGFHLDLRQIKNPTYPLNYLTSAMHFSADICGLCALC